MTTEFECRTRFQESRKSCGCDNGGCHDSELARMSAAVTWVLQDVTASLLTQLRTGHVPLWKNSHRIGRVDSPTCPTFQTGDEMVYYYVMVCLVSKAQRRHLQNRIWNAASSISTLLSNSKAFPHLFNYINDTQCFCDTPGDL